MARLEPLTLGIDERDERDRHVERHCGQPGKAVEPRFGRRIENLQLSERFQAGLFN